MFTVLKAHLRYAIPAILLAWLSPAYAEITPPLLNLDQCPYYLRRAQAFLEVQYTNIPYYAGNCHLNVLPLANQMRIAGFDPAEITTLILYHEDLSMMTAWQSRSLRGPSPTTNWDFHVILTWRGVVLDLDYTRKPTAICADEYFDAFFGLSALDATERANFRVRPVPFAAYLKWFQQNGTDDILKFLDREFSTARIRGRFPDRSVDDFLNLP